MEVVGEGTEFHIAFKGMSLMTLTRPPPLKASTTSQEDHTGEQAFNTRAFEGHLRFELEQNIKLHC